MLIMTEKVKLISAPFELAFESSRYPCKLNRVQMNQEYYYFQKNVAFLKQAFIFRGFGYDTHTRNGPLYQVEREHFVHH